MRAECTRRIRSLPCSEQADAALERRHAGRLSGHVLDVYRLICTALQIELESPASGDDAAAVLEAGIRIWPAFVQYVEALKLHKAIAFATNLTNRGVLGAWITFFKHYGLLVERHRDWRSVLNGDQAGSSLVGDRRTRETSALRFRL